MLIDRGGDEVAQRCAPLGYQYAFGVAQYPQSLGVDLGDEKGRPVPHDVIVVRAAACIDQQQPGPLPARFRQAGFTEIHYHRKVAHQIGTALIVGASRRVAEDLLQVEDRMMECCPG